MKTAAVQAPAGFKNILFATDFSPAVANAIPFVKAIAGHYQAQIFAFHVRPPVVNPMTGPNTWAVDLEVAKAEDEQHRREMLDTFPGSRTTVLIAEGGIQSCFQKAIKDYNIDLVVLGTHGRTGAAKLLLGSIAEEIFRNVECPVLTVGPLANFCADRSGKFHEVLFATDFSSDARHAAAFAVSLALESQAHLAMMHVIPDQQAGDLVSPTDVSRSVQELLHDAVPEEARGWCNVEYLVKRGNAAEKILETAQHKHSDLIVIGAKKETGVPGASTHLPIATAHKVVARATCPVLTVRS
jgi:nucleotide-binding universal stress UspA family protein